MHEKEILAPCDKIRQTAYELHSFLRHDHLEKVYENGLVGRLRKKGLHVRQQYPLQVRDEDGTVLGDYITDLFVENVLIVELKACKTLTEEYFAQVLGYIRASGQRHALLINFGAPRIQIKKFILWFLCLMWRTVIF